MKYKIVKCDVCGVTGEAESNPTLGLCDTHAFVCISISTPRAGRVSLFTTRNHFDVCSKSCVLKLLEKEKVE